MLNLEEKLTFIDILNEIYFKTINSNSFKSLSNKTQVIFNANSFLSNRMQHSLNVAFVSKINAISIHNSISEDFRNKININYRICELIGLFHDIGHMPFGHNAEKVLPNLLKNTTYSIDKHNILGSEIFSKINYKNDINSIVDIISLGIAEHNGEKNDYKEFVFSSDKINNYKEHYHPTFEAYINEENENNLLIEYAIVKIIDKLIYLKSDIEDLKHINYKKYKKLFSKHKNLINLLNINNKIMSNYLYFDGFNLGLNYSHFFNSYEIKELFSDLYENFYLSKEISHQKEIAETVLTTVVSNLKNKMSEDEIVIKINSMSDYGIFSLYEKITNKNIKKLYNVSKWGTI